MIEYTCNTNAIEDNTLTMRETDMVLKGLTTAVSPEITKAKGTAETNPLCLSFSRN